MECEDLLERMSRGIRRCWKCPLHASRTHAVPGEGNPRARIMVIGEAPGKEEDLQGRPFVGRTGEFFHKALNESGFAPRDLFITSAVKCRPPKNRTPRRTELNTCRDAWLLPQIDCVDPRFVLLLGKAPMGQLIGEQGKLADIHGTTYRRNSRTYLFTYHPSAAMRFPWAGKAFREDLQILHGLTRQERSQNA